MSVSYAHWDSVHLPKKKKKKKDAMLPAQMNLHNQVRYN